MTGTKLNAMVLVLLGVVTMAMGWRAYCWAGVAGVASAWVLWALLHITRMMQVLQRAARRPVGYVDSAVMLNARLKSGLSLLHVLALTRSLGERMSGQDEQPEVFGWSDAGQSRVRCEFRDGRLASWSLSRAPQPGADP